MAKTKTHAKVPAKAPAARTPQPTPEQGAERRNGRPLPSREAANTALPPANGDPAAARAGELLQFPGMSTLGRARMAAQLQKTVGNQRTGKPPTTSPTPASGGKATTPPEPQTTAAENKATSLQAEFGTGPAGSPPPRDDGGQGAPDGPSSGRDETTKISKSKGKTGPRAKKAGPKKAKMPKMSILAQLLSNTRLGKGKALGRLASQPGKFSQEPSGNGTSPAADTDGSSAQGPTPTAGASPGPTAGAPQTAQAAAAGATNAGSSEAVFEGLTRATASHIAAHLPNFGAQLQQGLQDDRQTSRDATPPLTTSATEQPPKEAKAPTEPQARPRSVLPPAPRSPAPSARTPQTPEERAKQAIARAQKGVQGLLAGQKSNADDFKKIPLEERRDEGFDDDYEPPTVGEPQAQRTRKVRTDAEATPRFKAEGDADTTKTETAQSEATAAGQAEHGRAMAQIRANNGEQRIQPLDLAQVRSLQLPESKAKAPKAQTSKEMDDYLAMPIEAAVRGKIDQAFAPTLEKSLTAPREKVEQGARKRDADHEKALQEAQDEATARGQQADQEQADAVAGARQSVTEEKERGLAEGREKLDQFEGELSQKRRDKLDEINQRVDNDEQEADEELDSGERKAEAEKKKAEKKADDEERKAEKKKRDAPWYKKVFDFFASIFEALKKVITKILDAVKSVVKGIIEAAQKLAKSIIDKLTSWVTAAIAAFGEFAKGLVSTFVGAVFPELAKKINAAIDKAVEVATEVVTKIADKLKEGIDYLAEKLNQAVDFIHNFYSTLVEGAFDMLKALATGDFLEIAKIAVRTAANSVGLPGEEIVKMLERAASQFLNVLKNPAPFIGNLIKSVMKGFSQFMGNFAKHIQTGLMGWIFGQVGATGIELPKKFDMAGIFHLVRQVLGLTYEYVRERVVSLVGADKVEKIERVAGYVKRLFTEGPEALWKEFKQYVGDLKGRIMGQISEWLVTKIVQAAIIKLTSMLVPGGGFLNAIISIYETIKFFIERIKQILEVVNSVLDSIEKIAKGAIGAAATFIENTMVKTMPLVMDFLARLLKVGNIGEKIRGVIDKLRAPVNKAVDSVVKGIVKVTKAGWGKVKEGAAKLREKTKKQRAAGDSRETTEFDDVADPTQMPQSREEQEAALSGAEEEVRDLVAKAETIEQITEHFPSIRKRYLLKHIGLENIGTSAAAIRLKINPDSRILFPPGVDPILDSPDSKVPSRLTQAVTFKKDNKGFGEWGVGMTADALGPSHRQGGPPRELVDVMSHLPTDPKTIPNQENRYIRGHLLNDNLGGPGQMPNLFPITADANKRHEKDVESSVKQWVNKEKKWVKYTVKVNIKKIKFTTPRDKSGANYVDAIFECRAAALDVKGRETAVPNYSLDKSIHSTFGAASQSTPLPTLLHRTGGPSPAESNLPADYPKWSSAKRSDDWATLDDHTRLLINSAEQYLENINPNRTDRAALEVWLLGEPKRTDWTEHFWDLDRAEVEISFIASWNRLVRYASDKAPELDQRFSTFKQEVQSNGDGLEEFMEHAGLRSRRTRDTQRRRSRTPSRFRREKSD